MIPVYKCYEVMTPESAEIGEAHDRGWCSDLHGVWRYQTAMDAGGPIPLTFRELISELETYSELSQSPCRELSEHVWATQYDAREDYKTGAVTSFSLHLADPKKLKYWVKALKYVGLAK